MAKSTAYRQGQLRAAKNGGRPVQRVEVLHSNKSNRDFRAGVASEVNRKQQEELRTARRGN